LAATAGTGIADRDLDELPGLQLVLLGKSLVDGRVDGFNGELAAVRHGIARINREVQERAFKLRGIRLDLPQPGRQNGFDADGFAERPVQKLAHSGDHLVDVQRLRFKRLLPRKCKQPLRQVGGTLRAVHGALDEAADVRVAPGQLALRQIESPDDDGQAYC
jgi:hypothetical protein